MCPASPLIRRRCAVLLVAALANAGCYSWRVESVAPDSLFATHTPSSVRVTRADSSRVVLDSPRLLGDTLAGSVDDHPFQMARSDVQGIETLHFSGGKTLGLLVGMAALVVVAIGAAFAIGCPNGACGN